MENAHPVIVIGRSFGAGGRSIGKELASALGYTLYDKELLKEAAKEFGFSPQIFERADEKRPSMLKRLVTQIYGVQESFITETLSSETLYQAQSRVIRALASRGPCIVIGRTADYILRDFPGLISVFVHAPVAYRALKIVERGDAPDEAEAIEMARQQDRRRQEYYNYFTGREWGVASNYDITLNSSLMPPAATADFLAHYVRERVKGANLKKS